MLGLEVGAQAVEVAAGTFGHLAGDAGVGAKHHGDLRTRADSTPVGLDLDGGLVACVVEALFFMGDEQLVVGVEEEFGDVLAIF